jgi:hypothetical protein
VRQRHAFINCRESDAVLMTVAEGRPPAAALELSAPPGSREAGILDPAIRYGRSL